MSNETVSKSIKQIDVRSVIIAMILSGAAGYGYANQSPQTIVPVSQVQATVPTTTTEVARQGE